MSESRSPSMRMTFRWYGPDDPVPLQAIRQIPCVDGVVTALHDLSAGEVWPVERLRERPALLQAHGLAWAVAESMPVHESIKQGAPEAGEHIEAYAQSIRNLGEVGISTVCYNFMPVFDWMRTEFSMELPDGSNTMQYVEADLPRVLEALIDGGFVGPIRPDHGRMIWGETGTPGYGLHDRALGATYLQGVLDGLALRGAA